MKGKIYKLWWIILSSRRQQDAWQNKESDREAASPTRGGVAAATIPPKEICDKLPA